MVELRFPTVVGTRISQQANYFRAAPLLKDAEVHRLVGPNLLQSRVLLLRSFQPLQRLYLDPAVLQPPPMIRRLACFRPAGTPPRSSARRSTERPPPATLTQPGVERLEPFQRLVQLE